jgi:hypothetical protein
MMRDSPEFVINQRNRSVQSLVVSGMPLRQ